MALPDCTVTSQRHTFFALPRFLLPTAAQQKQDSLRLAPQIENPKSKVLNSSRSLLSSLNKHRDRYDHGLNDHPLFDGCVLETEYLIDIRDNQHSYERKHHT